MYTSDRQNEHSNDRESWWWWWSCLKFEKIEKCNFLQLMIAIVILLIQFVIITITFPLNQPNDDEHPHRHYPLKLCKQNMQPSHSSGGGISILPKAGAAASKWAAKPLPHLIFISCIRMRIILCPSALIFILNIILMLIMNILFGARIMLPALFIYDTYMTMIIFGSTPLVCLVLVSPLILSTILLTIFLFWCFPAHIELASSTKRIVKEERGKSRGTNHFMDERLQVLSPSHSTSFSLFSVAADENIKKCNESKAFSLSLFYPSCWWYLLKWTCYTSWKIVMMIIIHSLLMMMLNRTRAEPSDPDSNSFEFEFFIDFPLLFSLFATILHQGEKRLHSVGWEECCFVLNSGRSKTVHDFCCRSFQMTMIIRYHQHDLNRRIQLSLSLSLPFSISFPLFLPAWITLVFVTESHQM